MSSLNSAFFSPRLIDYFVIVGSQGHNGNFGCENRPKILKIFPPVEHEDFSLPNETVYFCQPDDASSFVFTLTEKDRNRVRYGICLNFVTRISLPQKNVSLQPSAHCFLMQEIKIFCINFVKITLFLAISHAHSIAKLDLSSFWELFLFGRTPTEDVSKAELQIVTEVEKWILRLTSAPTPFPGHTYVQQIENPLLFALPDKSRLALLDFPFNLPFELLGVDKCLQVILAVILEQKVLVKSRDYNALTMSVLALVAMLYPLQYMFPVIPLLPTSLPGAEQVCATSNYPPNLASTPVRSSYSIQLPRSRGR
ncbi:unnamed protein product [Schistocephalus solidus]|uniref:UDENN domain-containing protein n=1 Tax=Schistocephalus solidus TaxID=70667 RepID=A0A183T7N9_SCHSO|nr:unnamed protein product [Schistocephalus solidus]